MVTTVVDPLYEHSGMWVSLNNKRYTVVFLCDRILPLY